MRTLTILLFITAAIVLAEQPKPAPAPPKLTEEERLLIENISLKEALLQHQFKALQEDKRAAYSKPCQRAGLELETCQFAPDGSISKRDASAKK